MGKARMSDTAAIAMKPPVMGIEKTIFSRKIDNGWVIRTSEYNCETGAHKSSECFSPDGRMPATGKVGDETLAATRRYLGGDT